MIKEKDFIEINYTGKTKEEELVFDTTDEKTAKENGLDEQKAKYEPIVICVGQGQVIQGLDKQLIGKEIGKEYSVEIPPEEAFGKKSAKLIQLVPTSKFKENEIAPQPGLQVNIDNRMGMIKTVSGGRTLVDFNHPLSGKEVVYDVKILRKVEDDKEKLQNYFKMTLGLGDVKAEVNDGKAEVQMKNELPKEIHEHLSNKVKEAIPSIRELSFKKEEQKDKSPKEKKQGDSDKKELPENNNQ